ncbi:MAG: Spy/CpxP family protein refolding chaperone [Acidiferrobacterales bacterium]
MTVGKKTIAGLLLGVLITFLIAIGSSMVLAHGGGQMRGSGFGMGSGMGSMGMGGPGMMGFGHRHHQHHMPMMGGIGMMGMGPGMMGMGPLWMLDLSDDQRTKLHKIQDELRKTHWNTMGKIMDESSKLSELFAADKPDAKKIGAVYGNIFDLRRQMIEVSIDVHNRMDAVLTKEQREQLEQMWRGRGPRYGGPGMMGPGMSRGGMMGG